LGRIAARTPPVDGGAFSGMDNSNRKDDNSCILRTDSPGSILAGLYREAAVRIIDDTERGGIRNISKRTAVVNTKKIARPGSRISGYRKVSRDTPRSQASTPIIAGIGGINPGWYCAAENIDRGHPQCLKVPVAAGIACWQLDIYRSLLLNDQGGNFR
jgi:hypothetical protein